MAALIECECFFNGEVRKNAYIMVDMKLQRPTLEWKPLLIDVSLIVVNGKKRTCFFKLYNMTNTSRFFMNLLEDTLNRFGVDDVATQTVMALMRE